MEHYTTQNFSKNLKLINKIEKVIFSLDKEKKARRVEVRHDYENRFIFGSNFQVFITEEGEKLKRN